MEKQDLKNLLENIYHLLAEYAPPFNNPISADEPPPVSPVDFGNRPLLLNPFIPGGGYPGPMPPIPPAAEDRNPYWPDDMPWPTYPNGDPIPDSAPHDGVPDSHRWVQPNPGHWELTGTPPNQRWSLVGREEQGHWERYRNPRPGPTGAFPDFARIRTLSKPYKPKP